MHARLLLSPAFPSMHADRMLRVSSCSRPFLYSDVLSTNRTNITEPSASYASSRGTLLATFLADLRGDLDLAGATTALTAEHTAYAGFNLLLLEPLPPLLPTTGPGRTTTTDAGTTLAYDARLVTNGGGGGPIRARTLSDDECACGGISNGVDGQGGDAWPKVVQGRAALQRILDEGSADEGPGIADADSHLAERLMDLLTCVTASSPVVVIQCRTAADWFFPISPSSGRVSKAVFPSSTSASLRIHLITLFFSARSPNPVPRERGELKNTILVPPLRMTDAPSVIYGTRLAQVVLVKRDGHVTYIERDVWTLDETGAAVRAKDSTRSFIFRLGSDG